MSTLFSEVKTVFKQSKFISRSYSKFLYLRSFSLLDIVNFKKKNLLRIIRPYSQLQYQQLSKIYDFAVLINKKGILGNFVECGVWNGGLSGLIAAVAQEKGCRSMWLFDSWEGLPEPKDIDVTIDGGIAGEKGMALGSIEMVKELLFKKLSLNQEKVHLIKGWFHDTLPKTKKEIGPIAFIHLDGDWYDSIKICLDELYDQVVKGGMILIDDYECWLGCKKAVDEFIDQRRIRGEKVSLKIIPFSCVYILK